MDPIFFNGIPYRAKKAYFLGTHRIKSPEETWEAIAPLAPQIGVTRIANVTGLDHIGIPVTAAIRPESLTLSTSSGKGLDLMTAQVSGLMESLELHCAEETNITTLHLPYQELSKRMATIPISQLPLRKLTLFNSTWPERWVTCWDLINQEPVAAPLLSVSLNYKENRKERTELCSFQMDSNGLASGNHFLEALLSGIYEVMERDAIACHSYASESTGTPLAKVRLETITYPKVREAIDRLHEAGFFLILYDCSIDTCLPVFKAVIYDKNRRNTRIAGGYGAHLDPEVAMIRTITEAVQGNTLAIAGSRDDMFSSHLKIYKKTDSEQTTAKLTEAPETVDASSYHSEATLTLEGDIHLLIEKLKTIGISQLLVFDLSKEELGVSVVRVIIPGLEGCYSQFSTLKRAKKFALKQNKPLKEDLFSYQQDAHLPAGGIQ